MAQLQSRMLANAAKLVRRGGAIVYSVCSIAPEEGADVTAAFLKSDARFKIDREPPNRAEIADLIDNTGAMCTRPDLGGLDGFYAARMVRVA